MENDKYKTPQLEENSLESTSINTSDDSQTADIYQVRAGLWARVLKKLGFLNINILAFVLLLLLSAMITYIGVRNNQRVDDAGRIDAQDLSSQAIDGISANNTRIGDPKQTLTIASNAIFNGKALFRDSIDVAGTIRVGGSLSLPGITVSGNSAFEDVIISNTLSTGGDANVSGNLSVQKGLTVSGGASFGGTISAAQLNIDRLTLNQDVTLNRHIVAGGPVPGVSVGGAAGSGGTASINGGDTAGTVTINTGGSTSAGLLATVNFANPFLGEPHVVITPVGSAAGNLNWYITRNPSGFTIQTNNAPAGATSLSFDYIVIN